MQANLAGFMVGFGAMATAFVAAPAAGRSLQEHGHGAAPAMLAGAIPLAAGLSLMHVGQHAPRGAFLAGGSAGAVIGLVGIPMAYLGAYVYRHRDSI